ncbi:hypothetical protein MRX96_034105 [Rhipicephalus microplus]
MLELMAGRTSALQNLWESMDIADGISVAQVWATLVSRDALTLGCKISCCASENHPLRKTSMSLTTRGPASAPRDSAELRSIRLDTTNGFVPTDDSLPARGPDCGSRQANERRV